MFYEEAGTQRRVRFHGHGIGKFCQWQDVVRPVLYLLYRLPGLRARVADLPQLAQLAYAREDQLKSLLQDPAIVFHILDIIGSLCI